MSPSPYMARLGALTEDLVTIITSIPKAKRERFKTRTNSTLRSLLHHSFLRTNPFEVESSLDGLEERFRVIGREALADALRARLDALEPHRTKWTPDILHLLIELSDRPAHKSCLSDLDLLARDDPDVGPSLTWDDVAREDGWDQDRALWRTIDYAPSSDDEDQAGFVSRQDDQSEASSSEPDSRALSSDERCRREALDAAILSPGDGDGDALLARVKESQAWRTCSMPQDARHRPKKMPISTMQLQREVLFMLGGLETTLFDPECAPVTNYQLAGVSWDTHRALVASFSECGRNLAPLRRFAKGRPQAPLVQVFQDGAKKSLRDFDNKLSAIQAQFVAIKKDVLVSLISVLVELKPALAPLYHLSSIVTQIESEQKSKVAMKKPSCAFRYLELLFDAVGRAQVEGSTDTYRLLGTIFFDCFRVYLRPVQLWMEEGMLEPGDQAFFIAESAKKRVPVHEIWTGRFRLLHKDDGGLFAPRFLHPSVHRILITGKSIVVLKHLGQYARAKTRRQTTTASAAGKEPEMDFLSVCAGLESGSLGAQQQTDDLAIGLTPFAELFDQAFNAWLESKHHTASATLRELLFTSYDLFKHLDALQHVFLMADGSLADRFAVAVFRHLDRLSPSWRDRFTLTEIAQEAFAAASCVDRHRLSARALVDADTAARGLNTTTSTPAACRSSVRAALPMLRIFYRLPWLVQVVVPEQAAMPTYQAVFTLLLQARRAISVLKRNRILASAHHSLPHSAAAAATAAANADYYYLVRAKLLWFCNTVLTYLTTLVLAPGAARMREDLLRAADVDAMMAAHAAFLARVAAEACLGPKLGPIRECVLDVFDLAVRLDDARRAEEGEGDADADDGAASRPHSAAATASRPHSALSARSSWGEDAFPRGGLGGCAQDAEANAGGGNALGLGRKGAGDDYDGRRDDDDDDDDDDNDADNVDETPSYQKVLGEVRRDFERHLRFVAAGLRGVARAGRDEAAGKWDLLAEMLEVGIRD